MKKKNLLSKITPEELRNVVLDLQDKMSLGELLTCLREVNQLTRKGAASRVGVTTSTIFNAENNKFLPHRGMLKLLAELYDFPMEILDKKARDLLIVIYDRKLMKEQLADKNTDKNSLRSKSTRALAS